MFRKLFNYFLLVVLLTVGIGFHLNDVEDVSAASIQIEGRIGGTEDTSFRESASSESVEKLAEPQEERIFLKKFPATGESKNFLFLVGLILLSCAYLLNKRYQTIKKSSL